MRYEEKKPCRTRVWNMRQCLSAASSLLLSGNYKSAANRSYYAVFHAMRAVLAYDEIDMKKHSGVIAEFRRLYVKTGVFDGDMSKTISVLFDVRTESDYDDFFIISKEEVVQQAESAQHFLSKK